MRVEFLGSGGAITTPRPGCNCRLCLEARSKGLPYRRTGPSVFIHGPNVLIDTPEEIKDQLNRSQVTQIQAAFYSHWHPDHTMGLRVWEMNVDWRGWPRQNRQTTIFLPQQVAQDFRTRFLLWDNLQYFVRLGIVRLVELQDGQSVTLGETTIRPFRVAQDYVYAFLFEEGDKRLLVCPDELYQWQPPLWLQGVDLAVLPMGICEFDPFTGERRIAVEHPVLGEEATLPQTLAMIRQIEPERAILTHIEEMNQMGFDDLKRLEEQLQRDGFNLTFAWDTLMVQV